jgi:hypothetical protein
VDPRIGAAEVQLSRGAGQRQLAGCRGIHSRDTDRNELATTRRVGDDGDAAGASHERLNLNRCTGEMRTLLVWVMLSILSSTLLPGCGLVFQGRTQDVTLRTTPPGATAALGGNETVTPGSVTMMRDQGWVVARASMPGYQSVCRLVPAPRNRLLVVPDCFPPVWLAVDLFAHTLRKFPNEVSLTLQPLEPGAKPTVLPPDDAILDAWFHGKLNLCNPYYDGKRQ